MRTILLLSSVLITGTVAWAAPDEELLGQKEGYPLGSPATCFWEPFRVGSFSGMDRIFRYHKVGASPEILPLPHSADHPEFTYTYQGKMRTLDDYLQRQRVTGLLIIKDGAIVAERYQYQRTAENRMLSNSMVKSIVSLAIGIALHEGKIHSLDDQASVYVPELKGDAYGETSLRHLLRMSSGVTFTEEYTGKDDAARFGRALAKDGTVAGLKLFQQRSTKEGEVFHYASIETSVLGLALHAATGQTLSQYVATKIWHPMGAEAEATWVLDSGENERAFGYFNATLRDYGRLGWLLANDGKLRDQQILPHDYLLEATDWHRQPTAFTPGKATSYFGYGYQFWLFPGEKRRFALLGIYGQGIFVDPELKLVMVHTAVSHDATDKSLTRERDALWRGLVTHFGSWK